MRFGDDKLRETRGGSDILNQDIRDCDGNRFIRPDGCRKTRICVVDDYQVKKIMIAPRNALSGDIVTTRLHQLGCRPTDGGVSDDRANGNYFRPGAPQCVADFRDRENGADACNRITRRNDHRAGFANRVYDLLRSARFSGAHKRNGSDFRLPTLPDEELLEIEPAMRRLDPRSEMVIGGGHQPAADAHGAGELIRRV